MLEIVIRPRARSDNKPPHSKLRGIRCRFAFRRTCTAHGARRVEAVQAIEEMTENPEMGNSIEHIRKGYRLYHFKHHIVIYRLSSTVIDVVRVPGEKMDVKQHL